MNFKLLHLLQSLLNGLSDDSASGGTDLSDESVPPDTESGCERLK